jgi:ABC-type Zn uptake system ZnuABC Zn-binding protein ZnuA
MRISKKLGVGVLAAGVGLVLGFSGCSKAKDPWKGLGGPPRVLVSFPPLYSFAKNVAGDDAAVLSLMISQGPHEHETTQADALKFQKATLFFMIGLELEKDELVDRLKKNSNNRDVRIVELGETRKLELRLLRMAGAAKEGKDEHGHKHGESDPHIWLGIPEAILMVEKIRDELSDVDPSHKQGYRRRAAEYVKQLQDLQEYGRNTLKGKKTNKLIAMHDSLRYFARSFGLEVVGSIQPRPGVEADGKQMAKLVEVCKKEGVRVIAVEPQYSQGSAERLKKELNNRGIKGVKIITIDPLETAQGKLEADFYVRKMRENLDALKKALP